MSVFLVSGASRGLGLEIVWAAMGAGHRVVAGTLEPCPLDEAAVEHGDRLAVIPLDVTVAAEVTAAVELAVARFGRLDVLVNNAGYTSLSAIEHVDFTEFQAQLDANLFGTVRLSRAVLPVMRAQGSGRIIQISSVGGRTATPGLGAYQTAKWAVGGFSSVLAAEVAPLGIAVTVLEPGELRGHWAGSPLWVDPVRPEYADTVGRSVARHEEGGGNVGGDPAVVARAVLEVAAMAEPPLRLLVGADAYAHGVAAGRALLAADERWREVSESTATAERPDQR